MCPTAYLFNTKILIFDTMKDSRPLKVRALEVAIKNIKNSVTPSAANIVFKRWECFHDNSQFKQAIKEKQLIFNNK